MKTNESKFINLKDLILDVLLSALVLVVSLVIVPLLSPLGLLISSTLAVVIPAVLGGSIYVLMTSKCPRIGTYFIFSMIFGIYFLVSGALFTAIFFLIAGLLGELSMIGDRSKPWRSFAPFIIHWLCYGYSWNIQFVFLRDTMLKTYMGMGMDEVTARATMESIAEVYTAPQNVVIIGISVILSSLLGYFIGTKVMNKHFKAAGVV